MFRADVSVARGSGAGHDPGVLTAVEARAELVAMLVVAAGRAGGRPEAWSRLAGLAAGDLVRVDDQARTGWGWRGSPWDPRPVRLSDGLDTALASLHPDGRVREQAVQAFAGRGEPSWAALLAVRCVDHVTQVRAAAVDGLVARVSPEDADAAVPVLLAVRGRRHGPEALAAYVDALPNRPGALRRLLGSADRRTRRWAFSTCSELGLLSVAELVDAVQDRRDQVVRRTAARAIGRSVEPEVLRSLLTGRYAEARLAALSALRDDRLSDADLRTALLDRSPALRDTARLRAARRGVDVAGFYRQVLETASTPRAVAAALLGLGWVGDPGDVPAVERRLADPQASVRAAAVRALAARADPERVARGAGPLLLDPSPRVAAAAAAALVTARAPAAEEAAWSSMQPWSQRAAWRLGRARGGWDRVEADLRIAVDEDPWLAALGRDSVLNWLRTTAATTWNRPSPAQADRMRDLLAAAALDPHTTRQIAFHAGLPRPPEEAGPAPDGHAEPRTGLLRRWFGRRR